MNEFLEVPDDAGDAPPSQLELALDILCAIIRSGTGGTKESKVAAAYEYAGLLWNEHLAREEDADGSDDAQAT